MDLLRYKVQKHDSTLSICSKFNITIEILINYNITKYPQLVTDPFVVMENWILSIPRIGNGNDMEYAIRMM